MTFAPNTLIAVRNLLLEHLNFDTNSNQPNDLEPAEVGIVGDPIHRGGYHCGSNRIVINDYSVVESSRDQNGLTLAAAGLDVGWFSTTVNGVTHNLFTFNRWMVTQLEAGTPDSQDIREWIYTLDGKTVRRWDRLRRRSTGDSSHLWHSHGSFFRDAIKANRDQTPLFRRYLIEIGLISQQENGMELNELMNADVSYTGSGALTFKNLLRNLHQQQHGPQFSDWESTIVLAELKLKLEDLTVSINSINARVDIDPVEWTAIREAVVAGMASSAPRLVQEIITRLPADLAELSREQVVEAVAEGVRRAFAHGLVEDGPA